MTQPTLPSLRRMRGLLAATSLAVGAMLPTAQAFENYTSWNGTSFISSFGVTNTATYGQTFVAPIDQAAPSFSFAIANTVDILVRPYIFEFDPVTQHTTGAAIFSGAAFTIASTGSLNTYATIPVNAAGGGTILAGHTYVVFLTTSQDQAGAPAVAARWGALTNNTSIKNGQFVFQNNGPNFSQLATVAWSNIGEDLAMFLDVNFLDLAQESARESGLAIASAMDQSILAGTQNVLGDINGHLFGLRAGGGQEDGDDGVIEGEGDGPESPMARKVRGWEVFTTVNYANVNLHTMGSQAGVKSYTWSPGVGVERHLTPNLVAGFAASLLETRQTYTGGLGSLDMEGVAISAYTSYVRRDYWVDLLYSYGHLDLESKRNPGFGFPVAFGNSTANTNAVQLNGGWKFHVPAWNVVHGPFAGVDYMNIQVDGYNEIGGGAAALRYGSRDVDSLITRVGWSASKKITTDFATITPQLRLSYERQNITNNNGTSVNLINQAFTASTNAQSPGQDYLVAGAGVNFQFSPALGLMLNYQGQFFRDNMQAHYGGLRLSYKF